MRNESLIDKDKKNHHVVFRKSVNDTLKAHDLPDLDEEEELAEDESTDIEEGIPTNIFDFCHSLMEKGEIVSYEIYRNSTFMARKNHPYSWEGVQKDHGEGHYRIIARSERTKKYVKQESRFVGAAATSEKDSIQSTIKEMMPRQPAVDPFDSIAKMATLLKSLTPAPVAPPVDQTPSMMIEFLKSMMTMQKDSQNTTMTLISEMQKSTQAMIEKIDKGQREALEKIEQRLSTKGGKDLDAMQLLSLVQGAEKRGMQNYLLLEEIAERKAASKGSGGGEEEESSTSKMIKTILPTVAAALSRAPQGPAQMPTRQPHRPLPQRPAPKPMTTALPQAPKPAVAVNQAPQAPQVVPRANIPAQSKAPVPTATIGGAPKQPPVGALRPTVSKEPSKDEMLNAVMLPLVNHMMRADEVKGDFEKLEATKVEAAQETKQILNKMNVKMSRLLQNVSRDDMLGIAKSVGLPIQANVWLTDYYSHLERMSEEGKNSAAPTQVLSSPAQTGNEKPQNT